MLPTNNSVPIENVVVAESGDDSDDDWDYIHVKKDQKIEGAEPQIQGVEQQKQQPQEHQVEQELEQQQEPQLVQELEHLEQEQQFHHQEFVDDEAAITSPTPPTASIGETDLINQESHAVAQAFAEPVEACSEVKIH